MHAVLRSLLGLLLLAGCCCSQMPRDPKSETCFNACDGLAQSWNSTNLFQLSVVDAMWHGDDALLAVRRCLCKWSDGSESEEWFDLPAFESELE